MIGRVFCWVAPLCLAAPVLAEGGASDAPLFAFGAMADCQHADQPDAGVRLYRRSPEKLKAAVADYNDHDLRYVVHLGDFIDKDWSSFDTLEPITAELKHDLRHVLGNHDFSVADEKKSLVPARMGLEARYYDFAVAKWRFIVVDGNDLSYHGWAKVTPRYEESVRLHKEKYADKPTWNGAVGAEQLAWIEKTIQMATEAGESVVLYCHFPIYPADVHNLWNADEVVATIEQYPAVKAWINGHNHGGKYGEKAGIHYLTLKGMVDTEETSYAFVKVFADRIEVEGVGRQDDLVLPLGR